MGPECATSFERGRLILFCFFRASEHSGGQNSNDYAEAEHDAERLIRVLAHGSISNFDSGQGFFSHAANSGFEQLFTITHDRFDVLEKLIDVYVVSISGFRSHAEIISGGAGGKNGVFPSL